MNIQGFRLVSRIILISAILLSVGCDRTADYTPAVTGSSNPAPAAMNSVDQPNKKVEPIDTLAERLRLRLANEPNDVEGWVLLGKSYQYLQRGGEAQAAFNKARELGFSGPLPDARAEIVEDPAKMLAKSSSLTAYLQRKFIPNETFPQSSADPGSPVSKPTATLKVTVALSKHLKSRVTDDDVLYVYARSSTGSPMPVAVAKARARDLPFSVVLNDSLAMTQEHTLSTVAEALVGARISRTGDAMRQSGDLETLSGPIIVGDADVVALVIDTVIE